MVSKLQAVASAEHSNSKTEPGGGYDYSAVPQDKFEAHVSCMQASM